MAVSPQSPLFKYDEISIQPACAWRPTLDIETNESLEFNYPDLRGNLG